MFGIFFKQKTVLVFYAFADEEKQKIGKKLFVGLFSF